MLRAAISCLLVVGAFPLAVRADEAEDKAVALVKKLGGKITRDDAAAGKPVTFVDLLLTETKDADVKVIVGGLPQIKELRLGGSKVTDESMKEVKTLKNLEKLNITHTVVSDAGLKELKDCKHLNTLDIYMTKKITDAGIKEFQKALPKCEIR